MRKVIVSVLVVNEEEEILENSFFEFDVATTLTSYFIFGEFAGKTSRYIQEGVWENEDTRK